MPKLSLARAPHRTAIVGPRAMRAADAVGRPRAVLIAAAIGAALFTIACGSTSSTTTGPSLVKCAVQVRADGTSFSAAGGTGTISVTANRECAWTAQADVGWVTLAAPASGRGEGTLTFSVAKNADPAARQAHVSIQDQQLPISQQAASCALRLSSTYESVGPAGGERSVHVSASSPQCSWAVATRDAWITLASDAPIRGDADVRFQVAATPGASRKGTITIGSQDLTVAQSACSIAVSPAAVAMPPTGGSGSVAVRATGQCAWSAESDADWIVIAQGASGAGPGEVRFSVAASDGPDRAAALHIADQTVNVTQGSGCSVAISPAALDIGGAGGAEGIDVAAAAGCRWTARSNAGWITISSGESGVGSGRVRLSIAPNTGPERTGAAVIGGRTVTVRQATACTYSVSPLRIDLPGSGGSGGVSIATPAGCPWTAVPQASWLSVSAGSGIGPAQVQVTAPASTGEPRSGMIAVAGEQVTVTEAAACAFRFSPASLSMAASGGQGIVGVFASGGCRWTAASNTGWITVISGQTGTGNGSVWILVAPNDGPPRTGYLTIGGQQYAVNQAAP